MDIPKKLEAGANLATIFLVVLLGWVLVRGGLAQPPNRKPPRQPPGAQVGTDLKRAPLDVNWAANGRTLLLGLQTTCHFCTESGPFFQKLPGAAAGNTKIVAVLPQSLNEAKEYLAKLGVRVDDVKQKPLSDIGVNGTPTLLLVDSAGVVTNVWVGKLPAEKQSEVLSAVGRKTTAPAARS